MTFAYNLIVYWVLVLIVGGMIGFLAGWVMCETRHRKLERRRKRINQQLTGDSRVDGILG